MVGREILERDLAALDRRRDGQVLRDGIVERDEPVAGHSGEQRGRERLRDRADLEHRARPLRQLAAAPQARLRARAHADHEAGVARGAALEDSADAPLDRLA